MDPLRLAFTLNILVLVPVCATLPRGMAAFEHKIPDSPGLRWLVASLWGGVLACSVLGLLWPRSFAFLLVFQVIYKSLYLAGHLLPTARTAGWRSLPLGVTLCFVLVVACYPWLLWQGLRGL